MPLSNSRLYRVAAGMIVAAGILLLMIFAKDMLIPFAMAGLLSLLLLPIKKKLMSWGFPKFWAVFCSEMLLLLFLAGILLAVSVQVMNFTDDLPELQKQANERLDQGKEFLMEHLPMTETEIDSAVQTASDKALSSLGDQTKDLLTATTAKLTNFGLTIVFTFLFLFYHERIREFLLRFSPKGNNIDIKDIIAGISRVAPHYLFGKFMLIMFLSVVYSIGLTIIGVPYGVLFGVLAAILSIIPYIGNLLGGGFPMIMMLLQGDGIWPIVAIIALFGFAQFLESYFLEPIIVGHNVDLNPMTIIIGVVVVGSLWGLVGMIIAIPLLGIMKIIFAHIEPLKPIAFLMENDEEESWLEKKVTGAFQWVKGKLKR